jgi:hypothetical protein
MGWLVGRRVGVAAGALALAALAVHRGGGTTGGTGGKRSDGSSGAPGESSLETACGDFFDVDQMFGCDGPPLPQSALPRARSRFITQCISNFSLPAVNTGPAAIEACVQALAPSTAGLRSSARPSFPTGSLAPTKHPATSKRAVAAGPAR